MSEKTAEEKLRQALEDSTTGTEHEPPKSQKKPRPSRARPKSSPTRAVKSENLGERLDSFMDDFERRIEESLNAVKSPSETHEKPGHEKPGSVKISAQPKPETSRRVRARPKTPPEPLEELIPSHSETPHSESESAPETQPIQEDLPVAESESLPEIPPAESESAPETESVQEDLPVPESEPLPEVPHTEAESVPEVQPVQEEITPDVMPLDEAYEPEPELPDIPVIEAEFDSVPDSNQDIYGGLPDIPVISADDDIDDTAEIFTDGLEDITPPDETDTSPREDETDEPRKKSHIDFQETELLEADENEDEFADIDDDINDNDEFTDEPLDEEPAQPDTEDTPHYDVESGDDNGDDSAQEDFSPAADVVLNVDDEIPHITPQPETEIDPESESVPVTVTMPESTKTAEDQLMADIAEAMTGNPLTLDSQEQPGLYNLPENFFTDSSNNPDSPQSAEDKLKANIAQALSESPINTAQDQANQSLEHDINPFDELSITDTVTENETHDEELPPEALNDDDDELFTEKTHDEQEILTEDTNDANNTEESLTETDFDAMTENDSEPQTTDDVIPNDPFTIPDFGDNDTETEPDILIDPKDETEFFTNAFMDSQEKAADTEPESEPESEPEPELPPDIPAEPETITTPEVTPEPEPEAEPKPAATTTDDDMPFPVNDEPENLPLTEQEALIAMVSQQFEPEENTQEEAHTENNMPEQSLLDDNETTGTIETEENNDDWDISNLGVLGQAATLAEDHDDFSASPETVTEIITQPEPKTIHNPEDDHKEKTMSIREKLALRKNKTSDGQSKEKSKSGLLLPLLMLVLAVIGGLILWQLMTLSDKITSMAMNAPGYESVSGTGTPSYEYAIDFILDPNLADRMTQRGREGWQVAGSRRTQDSTTGQYGYEFIFMRRTPGR